MDFLFQLFEYSFSDPEKSSELWVQGTEEFCCSQKNGGEQGVEREGGFIHYRILSYKELKGNKKVNGIVLPGFAPDKEMVLLQIKTLFMFSEQAIVSHTFFHDAGVPGILMAGNRILFTFN